MPQRRSKRGRETEGQENFSQQSVDSNVIEASQRTVSPKAKAPKAKTLSSSPGFKEPMPSTRTKKQPTKPQVNDSPVPSKKGILKNSYGTARKSRIDDKVPQPAAPVAPRDKSIERDSSGGSQESEIIESSQYNLSKSVNNGDVPHPQVMPLKEPKFFKARYRERMASQNPHLWSPRPCLTNRTATPMNPSKTKSTPRPQTQTQTQRDKIPVNVQTQSVKGKAANRPPTQSAKDTHTSKFSGVSEIHSKDSAPLSSIGSPVTESQDPCLIHRKPTPKVQSRKVKSPYQRPLSVEPEEVYEFEPGEPMQMNKKTANPKQSKKNEGNKSVSKTDTPSKSVHFNKGKNKAQNKNTSRLLVDDGMSNKPSSSKAGRARQQKSDTKTDKGKIKDSIPKRKKVTITVVS